MIALGVFPVLLPLFYFDQNKKESWFYLFLLLAFLIGCAAIAYTITLPEEFGKRSPRQHLRYLEPFAIPFYIMMRCHLKQTGRDRMHNRLWQAAICLFSVVLILVGGGGGSCLVTIRCGYTMNFLFAL